MANTNRTEPQFRQRTVEGAASVRCKLQQGEPGDDAICSCDIVHGGECELRRQAARLNAELRGILGVEEPEHDRAVDAAMERELKDVIDDLIRRAQQRNALAANAMYSSLCWIAEYGTGLAQAEAKRALAYRDRIEVK